MKDSFAASACECKFCCCIIPVRSNWIYLKSVTRDDRESQTAACVLVCAQQMPVIDCASLRSVW